MHPVLDVRQHGQQAGEMVGVLKNSEKS